MQQGIATQQPAPGWMKRVNIRQVREADLPALEWDGEFSHFRRLFADAFRSYLQDRSVLWMAEVPGFGAIGQLFVQLNSSRTELADGQSRAYIYGFRVREPYRGYGIGSQILDAAEDDLRRRGFRWVTLNVAIDNPDARRLYERLGYRVIAHEPGDWTYQDQYGRLQQVHEPAWRMEKTLRREGQVKNV